MFRFAFYQGHIDTTGRVDFRETRVNVGYSLDTIVRVQTKCGHLDDNNRGTGEKEWMGNTFQRYN